LTIILDDAVLRRRGQTCVYLGTAGDAQHSPDRTPHSMDLNALTLLVEIIDSSNLAGRAS
jgi:hypothetical protein